MVELNSPVKIESNASPEVARFLQSERNRPQHTLEHQTEDGGFSVKKMMQALQSHFSNTSDISNEIAEMVEAQVEMRTRELFRQANYDALTHLPNRAYFNTTLEQLVVKAQDTETEFGLLFLDLDGFKAVNDTLGHQAGDELLRNVSARLMSAVREGDIVSRLGGDEFVVLLADVTDKELIEGVSQRIIREVSRPYWINRNDVEISTSIGISRYPLDGKTSAELVDHADQALYVSKHSGRRTYRFYDEVAEQVISPKHVLVNRLHAAVENGDIEAVFEPQIDLTSGGIVGASITAKWNEPEIGNPYLANWIEMLNESQAGYTIGAWLMDSGLYYLQQWQKYNDAIMVSIPVIDALWQQEDLVTVLNERFASYGILASQVQLEFTVQSLNEHEALHEVLNALTTAGYQITLSDVGKSPLDLSSLALLNLQELKLNRDWLQSTMATEKGQKWVQALVQMAKSLDICVIATGVETTEEAQQYQVMGCSMAQGDNWSAPVDAKKLQQTIQQQLPVIA
ncbi:putative bifunctional diguanylate cyclase/phosphodiesterase [Thiomicrorhabdus lithotrophica]|uniref:Diguanylate cyclase n=1 Tax=Thiomicrorhabdus lithotrophica TaxID=2949997 RepID=A0ABY8CAN1_9GAMM|nr:diguanylate cyclase [Thiomicrorhabdus lithotrophica]WEJ62577.1 diguanylate cyclase [Thiomicrorhabdus lithotrophica]